MRSHRSQGRGAGTKADAGAKATKVTKAKPPAPPGNDAPAASSTARQLGRWLVLLVLCAVCLQAYFALRILAMRWIDPQSTSFQRSEVWRQVALEHRLAWRQDWVDDEAIAPSLKRAVIASEDASFALHGGVEWDAIERAWERNQRSAERAERLAQPLAGAAVPIRLVGGSTITQQLAKNLFLSGERALTRKGQEFVITMMLEALLPKRRILEIYLNSVEWGDGVFGAEAAARHYHRVSAQALTPWQAARLAVMLPAPKRFEKRPGSAYLSGRANAIVQRMRDAELP